MSVWLQGAEFEHKDSGILKLAENGTINLYCREKIDSPHFIINDEKIAWLEELHLPLASLCGRKAVKVERGADDFKRIMDKFERYIHVLQPSQKPREDFILLTPSRIDAVQSQCNLSEMSRDDINKLLISCRI